MGKYSDSKKNFTENKVISEKDLTIVEKKRIEDIKLILEKNKQLTSSELNRLIGLSRTRCNEYFKQMEELGLVEGIDIGKERYYKLRD